MNMDMIQPTTILESELTTFRPIGGQIDAIDVIQRGDSKWYITVYVSWMPREPFMICQYNERRVKLYSCAASALRHIVHKYRYCGKITVQPREGMTYRTLI